MPHENVLWRPVEWPLLTCLLDIHASHNTCQILATTLPPPCSAPQIATCLFYLSRYKQIGGFCSGNSHSSLQVIIPTLQEPLKYGGNVVISRTCRCITSYKWSSHLLFRRHQYQRGAWSRCINPVRPAPCALHNAFAVLKNIIFVLVMKKVFKNLPSMSQINGLMTIGPH